MSPLRGAASRGHIAQKWLIASFLTGKAIQRLALCRFGVPLPHAAARKAPRLFLAASYPRRWRCRRLHITRGHIAHPNLTVRVPHRIRVQDRLNAGNAPTHAGSQRLRVFRFGTDGGAPLQNPKTLALPVAT
jgi:hypothetical protein